jgi:hypothetical protein
MFSFDDDGSSDGNVSAAKRSLLFSPLLKNAALLAVLLAYAFGFSIAQTALATVSEGYEPTPIVLFGP